MKTRAEMAQHLKIDAEPLMREDGSEAGAISWKVTIRGAGERRRVCVANNLDELKACIARAVLEHDSENTNRFENFAPTKTEVRSTVGLD